MNARTLRPRASRLGRGLDPRLDQRGLGMVEVLMAIVVFTVGALGLASVIPLGMHRVTDSAASTRASEICSERCEKLLAIPYEDPDLDIGNHDDDNNPYDGVYDLSWNVELNQPRMGCKRVTVSVKRTGTSRTIVRLVIVTSDATG